MSTESLPAKLARHARRFAGLPLVLWARLRRTHDDDIAYFDWLADQIYAAVANGAALSLPDSRLLNLIDSTYFAVRDDFWVIDRAAEMISDWRAELDGIAA